MTEFAETALRHYCRTRAVAPSCRRRQDRATAGAKSLPALTVLAAWRYLPRCVAPSSTRCFRRDWRNATVSYAGKRQPAQTTGEET
jgi:hypothetical protein